MSVLSDFVCKVFHGILYYSEEEENIHNYYIDVALGTERNLKPMREIVPTILDWDLEMRQYWHDWIDHTVQEIRSECDPTANLKTQLEISLQIISKDFEVKGGNISLEDALKSKVGKCSQL